MNGPQRACFWCGGRPAGYRPCPTCRAAFALGIAVIEVVYDRITRGQPAPPEHPPIVRGAIPTGRWMVITRAAAERNARAEPGGAWERALTSGRILVLSPAFQELLTLTGNAAGHAALH